MPTATSTRAMKVACRPDGASPRSMPSRVPDRESSGLGGTGPRAEGPPAAASRDRAELLDVDVDQLAGPGAFVAADDLPAGPVQPGQPRHRVPDQHPVHGGRVEPEDPGDPSRAEPAVPAQSHDRRLQQRIGARGTRPGPRRAVQQAGAALGPVAGQPLVGGRARDAHLSGHLRGRATRRDPLDEQQARPRRQTGLSVDHEDLQAVKTRRLHGARRSSSDQLPPRRVNKVHGHYS
jgi:hypothetical protein